MKNTLQLMVIIWALSTMDPTWALGKTGHRVVGQIAANHLTPAAKAAVKKILGEDGLAEVSNWPDFMRSDPHPFWNKYSTAWHYANIEQGLTYASSRKNPKGDIYVAINAFIDILSDKPLTKGPVKKGLTFYFGDLDNKKNKLKLKQFALKFLDHLIGDLHQPLHIGHRADQGGNKIPVEYFGQKTNLHAVWDSDIIDSSRLSYTELTHFIDTRDKKRIKRIQNSTVSDWVTESLLLRDEAYTVGKSHFRYRYYYKNYPILQQQMLKAGLRLAAILNRIYPSPEIVVK